MKTPILWLSLCLGTACSSTPLVVDAAGRQTLFRVTKSENANYVVYDLLLDEDGRIAAEPLEAYWIMAENGGERVGLSSMELGVYDVAVENCDREAGCLVFKINGVDSKLMTVTVPGNGEPAEVSTMIDGRQARLTEVHLLIQPTWNPLRPDVQVHLAGLAIEGGRTEAVEEVVSK